MKPVELAPRVKTPPPDYDMDEPPSRTAVALPTALRKTLEHRREHRLHMCGKKNLFDPRQAQYYLKAATLSAGGAATGAGRGERPNKTAVASPATLTYYEQASGQSGTSSYFG